MQHPAFAQQVALAVAEAFKQYREAVPGAELALEIDFMRQALDQFPGQGIRQAGGAEIVQQVLPDGAAGEDQVPALAGGFLMRDPAGRGAGDGDGAAGLRLQGQGEQGVVLGGLAQGELMPRGQCGARRQQGGEGGDGRLQLAPFDAGRGQDLGDGLAAAGDDGADGGARPVAIAAPGLMPPVDRTGR